jgi:hypothetical protein
MPSEKFTQIGFPCVDCLVNATCREKPDKEVADPNDYYPMVLAFKKWDESKKVYRKGLLECWVNMGRQIIDKARDKDCTYKPQSMNPAFLDFILAIIGMLEYIIHSTSWAEGEKQDFDIVEIQRQLDLARGWIKSSGRFK